MSQEVGDLFSLKHDWLSVQEVVDAVTLPSCGAISVFIGTTREDEVEGRKVIGLEYEAYESMVQSEFSKLCCDIRARCPTVAKICVHHRLGSVKVAEASVVMAISSPHRKDSEQAIQLGMKLLKANIPIWKKEVYHTQEVSWKENAECEWAELSH
ncbi:molybdopterin synthase catalytic subunit [Gouania willdenowi]|uniref:MOCS2B n=1 Tax=Gouania willdenowi TaxID=441366 RepID=A0A8C5G4G2_GOUWI|nr:molybdopterin synthase catalytic subunit [Gouania willdenowi]